MKTPTAENTLFSFCARMVWNASRTASAKRTQAAWRWSVAMRPSRSVTTRAPPPVRRRHARVDQRQLHVVERGGARQQVEGLEDEPDFLVADARQLVVGEVAHFQTVEPVLARGGGVEAADEVHERRLPRSRRAHHGHVLVLADLEAHAAQRAHDLAAHVVVAGELVREDHDVRLWRVAGAELLEAGHAYFFFLVVSAACFIGRTRALSLRSRIDW